MAGTAGFFHGTSVSAWNSARHRTYLQCSAAQSTATKPQKVSVQEVTDFRKVRNSLASVWLEWLSLQAAAVPPALLVPAAVLGLELSSDCVHFILQTWLPRLLQSQDSTRKWLQLATERRQVLSQQIKDLHHQLAAIAVELADTPGVQLLQGRHNGHAHQAATSLQQLLDDIQSTNWEQQGWMHDCSVLDQQYEALTSGRHERDQRAATVEADAFSVVRQLDVLELKIQQREVQKKREEAERLRVQEQERQAAAEVAAVLERENAQWRLLEQELHEEAEQHMRLEAVRNDFEQISTFAPTVRVQVCVQCPTKVGEALLLLGGHTSLGDWDVSQAAPMTWGEGHVWTTELELPSDCTSLSFKAVLRKPDGSLVWEKGDNKTADLLGSRNISVQYVFAR
eukprot:jgi/Chrzof1/7515/Cz02g26180.t1